MTIIGIDRAGLSAILAADRTASYVLRLDLAGTATVTAMIGRVLDDLADLAGSLWPGWSDTARSAPAQPLLSTWRRTAARFVLAGRRPRFAWMARETEIAHLLSVLPGLVLLAEVDPLHRDRAMPVVTTLEWCCQHGAGALALLTEPPSPEPPWDRLLSGAVIVEQPAAAEPALNRLISPMSVAPSGGSAIERRMRVALQTTPDLAGLFEDQVMLHLGPLGPTPRVDLLWRHGKVVVELDGPEHGRDPTYAADRHRDYELLVAGYLVLRLTNAEVELDLGRSLDKVRRVVGLRRNQR